MHQIDDSANNASSLYESNETHGNTEEGQKTGFSNTSNYNNRRDDVQDTHQALRYFEQIGYNTGDVVHLRMLPPKIVKDSGVTFEDLATHSGGFTYLNKKRGEEVVLSRPFKLTLNADPSKCKLEEKKYGKTYVAIAANGIDWLQEQNERGWAVYACPNPGGENDRDIVSSNLIFWEDDELTKDEQLARFQQYLAETGFRGIGVETQKSWHCYVVTEKITDLKAWKTRQLRIVQKFNSDKSIVSEAQLMRPPGFYHTILELGGNIRRTPVTMLEFSGRIATIAELEATLPEVGVMSKATALKSDRPAGAGAGAAHTSSAYDEPPLDTFISPEHRELIRTGLTEGGRNSAACAVAMGLIGAESRLHEMGIRFEGSARSLYDDFCSNCSPALESSEADSVWESAAKSNPDGMAHDIIKGCLAGWQKRNKATLIKRSFVKPSVKPLGASSAATVVTAPTLLKMSTVEGSKMTHFNDFVVRYLYSETEWITIDNVLHRWTGTHYEASHDREEQRRITRAAKENAYLYTCKKTENPDGSIYEAEDYEYPFISTKACGEALAWVKMQNPVDPALCNPTGLNCTNGVLQLRWDGGTPKFDLVPHDPELYYLYPPAATYDPSAHTTDCDNLLAALEPGQREVFLRTIAASFDLDSVRKRRGRDVKALICRGVGSNGKDTLRAAVSLLFGGVGVTAVSLGHFQDYDGGRQFNVKPLRASRVNWASENSAKIAIDDLQSLKAAITGDTLYYERKGVDSEPFEPKAIQLFNLNGTPYFSGGQEAIKSRYGVLTFEKVFCRDADPSKGQIEVDPRFKNDEDFLVTHVLSSLLNKLVEAFKALITYGIDWNPCESAMIELQDQNSHLLEFARDSGLKLDQSAIISCKDLWLLLEAHYRDSGVLTTNSVTGKNEWAEAIRPGDPYIKGANQLPNAIRKLYPQVKRVSLGKNLYGFQGLKIEPVTSEAPKPVAKPAQPVVTAAVEPSPDAEVLTMQLADQIHHLHQNPVKLQGAIADTHKAGLSAPVLALLRQQGRKSAFTAAEAELNKSTLVA
jgi:phage/plasmid-associated DNA primase